MSMWPFKPNPKRPAEGQVTIKKRRTQIVPQQICRWFVSESVLRATETMMQRFADEERECYVWWSGSFDCHGNAQILTALGAEIPTSFGRVELIHNSLLKLHENLRALDQVLLVELHTHPPGAGGQNSVDAAHPAATYRGFISIVVPNFCRNGLKLEESHVYEYMARNEWRQLRTSEVRNCFVVEPNFVSVEL